MPLIDSSSAFSGSASRTTASVYCSPSVLLFPLLPLACRHKGQHRILRRWVLPHVLDAGQGAHAANCQLAAEGGSPGAASRESAAAPAPPLSAG